MQFEILFYVILLITILVGYANIRALYNRSKLRKQRENIGMQCIYADNFSFIDFKVFSIIWIKITNIVRVDKEILRPCDTIGELVSLFPFREILIEDLEELFIEEGISKLINDELSIAEIVRIIGLNGNSAGRKKLTSQIL